MQEITKLAMPVQATAYIVEDSVVEIQGHAVSRTVGKLRVKLPDGSSITVPLTMTDHQKIKGIIAPFEIVD